MSKDNITRKVLEDKMKVLDELAEQKRMMVKKD